LRFLSLPNSNSTNENSITKEITFMNFYPLLFKGKPMNNNGLWQIK